MGRRGGRGAPGKPTAGVVLHQRRVVRGLYFRGNLTYLTAARKTHRANIAAASKDIFEEEEGSPLASEDEEEDEAGGGSDDDSDDDSDDEMMPTLQGSDAEDEEEDDDDEVEEAEPEAPAFDPVAAAAARKAAGNEKYKAKDYYGALDCYSEAIKLDPANAMYYGNRAAAELMVNQSSRAVTDCKKGIELDSTNIKTHLRLGKPLFRLSTPRRRASRSRRNPLSLYEGSRAVVCNPLRLNDALKAA